MADDDPTRRLDPGDNSTRRLDPDDFATVRGLSAGRTVFGRYLLEAELGAGGMGVVWRARDTELDEPLALKFLPEVVARDDAAVAELKAETRHARRLTHPNIVRIHQFEREGLMTAVSMEFVDGMTLTKVRLAQPGEVFAAETLAPLVVQLCAALDYAHGQAKIVHRDLKPANILVTCDGVVKVADFGIARSLSDTHTRLTGRAGDTSGTLVYMSPQQLRGADPAASDDIYALGATLYELLTGKPPFYTGDVAWQIREETPKSVNARLAALNLKPVPSEWEDTILACLAKEREDRPQSAGEVARYLTLAGSVGSDLGPAVNAPVDSGPAQEQVPPAAGPVKGANLEAASIQSSADSHAGAAKTEAPPTERANRRSGITFLGKSGTQVRTHKPEGAKRRSKFAFVAVLGVLAVGVMVHSFWPKKRPAPKSISSLDHYAEIAVADQTFEETRAKAEKGHVDAQVKLGQMYATGDRVPKDDTAAVKWFRKAADQEDAMAQNLIGRAYLEGTGVSKDANEAIKWFKKAADRGNANAQFSLGGIYALSEDIPRDDAKAAKWYRMAADQGNADAQNCLGFMYDAGRGVPKDSAEAVRWYRKAADQGNAAAQSNLGLMYADGDGVPKDGAEAVKWYRMAADQGDAGGQYNVGLMYAKGNGVAKDSAEAVKWYRKAADHGNALAQFSLGWMYDTGDGVAKDGSEAWEWYRKAADQGYLNAQICLGSMDLGGRGVPKDSAAAMKWFRKAADQGNSAAQACLGAAYRDGEGVPKDSAEAVKWFRKAADQGYSDAQFCLSAMYAAGDGVPKDEIEALAWVNVAAASGNDSAVKYRDALELRLGREMTLAAQQRSKDILKSIEAAKAR
jgi:hypothetical protein